MNIPENLSPEQTAEYLGGSGGGINPNTLAKWRWQGFGPPYLKVGRLVRYRRQDIDAWLASRLCQSTADVSDIDGRNNDGGLGCPAVN